MQLVLGLPSNIVFGLLLLSSIKGTAQIHECPAGEYYQYVNKSTLKNTTKYGSFRLKYIVDTGDSTVFTYNRVFDCPDVFDDQLGVLLQWSIPDTANAFELNMPEDSLRASLDYHIAGGGFSSVYYFLNSASGYIKGVKNGKVWNIEGRLSLVLKRPSGSEKNETVEFSHDFVPLEIIHKKKKKKK